MTPEKKTKDWPMIVAGTAFATGLTIFFFFGVWLLADAPPLLGVLRIVPVAGWLMAFGCVMAIGLAAWRTMRYFFWGPNATTAAPKSAVRVPMRKPVILILAGMLLFVAACYLEEGDIGILTVLAEFVLLVGVMLAVHRLESVS